MIELENCPCCGEKAAMRESWEPLTVSGFRRNRGSGCEW